MTDIEIRITQIEERNKRVESEKAWETSAFRKVSIVVLTYLIMLILFHSMGSNEPFKSAIVPTLGYFMSTLSLEALRRYWLYRNL